MNTFWNLLGIIALCSAFAGLVWWSVWEAMK